MAMAMAMAMYACSLLLLLFWLVAATDAAVCDPRDREVLLKVKDGLKNAAPFSTWDPKTDCCSWEAISCGSSGRVTDIIAAEGYRVNGSFEIPPVIGDLPMLGILWLEQMPWLVGSIPESITKHPNIYQLILSDTNLSGPLPDFSYMKNLASLYLNNNHFSGTIPESFHLLPKLHEIDLSNNNLSGPIPDTFGLFKNSFTLWLRGNKHLSGDIPRSLAQVSFNRLYLEDNQFTGDASFLMGIDKGFVEIRLAYNQFEFDFSNVQLPLSIKNFDISHNKIYGSLNKQLPQCRQLEEFDVSYNQLCGKVPKGRRFKQIKTSGFDHNKCLCDALGLPPCNSTY